MRKTKMRPNGNNVIQHVHVQENLTCHSSIELTYYSAGYELICIHYGPEDYLLEKEGYYPQCKDCIPQVVLPEGGKSQT